MTAAGVPLAPVRRPDGRCLDMLSHRSGSSGCMHTTGQQWHCQAAWRDGRSSPEFFVQIPLRFVRYLQSFTTKEMIDYWWPRQVLLLLADMRIKQKKNPLQQLQGIDAFHSFTTENTEQNSAVVVVMHDDRFPLLVIDELNLWQSNDHGLPATHFVLLTNTPLATPSASAAGLLRKTTRSPHCLCSACVALQIACCLLRACIGVSAEYCPALN